MTLYDRYRLYCNNNVALVPVHGFTFYTLELQKYANLCESPAKQICHEPVQG